ncbi:MAG: ribosomal L7Ae/L30e/S12e/Gadd45 family protein [Eubacteriales bacterium]|nr:ribosomal L7Ae/L30e/S12e/Gadd45 family protein [Eubacteriales bacterium]
MNKKIMSMFSLCQKAGKIVSGEFAVEKALQDGSANIVIIAGDASANTKKKFENKAFFYEIETITFSTKEEISQAIGKLNRSVFAIIDEGFANKIKCDIKNLNN